jgi:hypothetical protein
VSYFEKPRCDLSLVFSRKEPPIVMPSLFARQKKKRLDYTDLECLEEAGCRCRLSVPRASRDDLFLRATPAQPHRCSGIWGQTIALRNPQS